MKFSHYAVGHAAEARAARYLERLNYQIIDRNWRTRLCEIDIIAPQNNTIYFVEVKYRADTRWGGGLDYVTPRKHQQMRFAAHYWLARHKITGQSRLAALSIDGNTFRLEFLDD
jgi:uncharacterized protein (TIGR00252 family)